MIQASAKLPWSVRQFMEMKGPVADYACTAKTSKTFSLALLVTMSLITTCNFSYLALILSQPLNLDLPVSFLALGISDAADSLAALRNNSEARMAFQVASDVFNQHRGLTDVARLTIVSERTVRSIYRAIHCDRYELVVEG
ncbi:hypothetical protein BDR22DRAFT_975478 [Usnea florida]